MLDGPQLPISRSVLDVQLSMVSGGDRFTYGPKLTTAVKSDI
jgi:hypothetical protein